MKVSPPIHRVTEKWICNGGIIAFLSIKSLYIKDKFVNLQCRFLSSYMSAMNADTDLAVRTAGSG